MSAYSDGTMAPANGPVVYGRTVRSGPALRSGSVAHGGHTNVTAYRTTVTTPVAVKTNAKPAASDVNAPGNPSIAQNCSSTPTRRAGTN